MGKNYILLGQNGNIFLLGKNKLLVPLKPKHNYSFRIMEDETKPNELHFSSYQTKLREVFNSLIVSNIDNLVEVIWDAYIMNKNIFICGNGGSSSNASHFAQDLIKGTTPTYHGLRDYDNKSIRAISLCDNISFITATSNDDGYEYIFVNQLKVFANPFEDVLIAISGSGNSSNILKAVQWATQSRIKVIGITGFDGGELKKKAEFNVHVPLDDMCMTEAIHSIIFHYVVEKIKEKRIKQSLMSE